MKLLKEAVDRTIQGEGGLVFLYGEAGIGKTRLARELGAYARLRGMLVLYGRCPALFRMDGVPPYILWREVIRDYLENSRSEQLYRVIGLYPAEIAKLVPELGQRLATIPQSFPINPEQERNRFFEAVSQFVTNISRETPLLVVLDDLQWTDPSSLLLFHYLALGVHRTRLLLLGAYRSTDIDSKHPLTPVLTDLNRERLLQYVSLKRMSPSDISEMIERVLEQNDVPPEFCRIVYEKTRGNPFFAEEVMRSLKEEDVIYREENKWKIKEVSEIGFPETVKSVIEARIGRLGDEGQHVLMMASLVGNDFTFEVLRGLVGFEEDKLRKVVDELLKTGLLKNRVIHGEDVCSFADIIVRDVVYEGVGTFERNKLHGVVGHVLEKVYAERIDEHFGELALHFLEGGEKDRALDYFLKAGDKAAKIYANSEATSYFQSALRLLEEKEGELQEKKRVLERLGDIKNLVGEYDACLKYWGEALLLLTKPQKQGRTAVLHRKMANVLWDKMGDVEKAKKHQDNALEALQVEPESVELAHLYEDMSHMYWRNGEIVKALSLAEKALVLAEKLNALDAVAESCNELAILLINVGDFRKGLECTSRALKIALANNYYETAVWAYYRVGQSLPNEEWEKSLGFWEKGLALARKLGDIGIQSSLLNVQALLYIQMGELDKAITCGEEGVALNRRAGNITYLSMSLSTLGFAYQLSGEWDKSRQRFAESSDISRKLDEFQPIADAHFNCGFQHFDKQEYTEARESFEESVKVAEKAGSRMMQMWNSQFLIWAYIELGEVAKSQDLLDSLQKFALETGDRYFGANGRTLRAMSFRGQRKYEESIELFEETLREWESIKADIWNAYWFARMVLCEYSHAYLERNEEGDKEKARSLLNRALGMFRKMGAKKDIEKVEAKMTCLETGQAAQKPMSMGHVATGYADLDKLLYGGIPATYAVALASPSCDERDLLIRNFLEAGAKNGEVTFYVTMNPGTAKALAEEFQSNFHLFICNPQADTIVKSTPNVVKLKGVENLTDISIALTSAIRKLDPSLKGPRRACIGLVSDVLLQHHTVQTRRWLTGLIPELQSEGFTTLAVMDPEIHPPEEVRAISGLFEGEVSLYEKETEKGLERFLKIKKMSNQKYLANEIALTKTSKVS
jgi:tetratricopeptide (TPR) repeat protein/KaiC/GvpD/RAD55 family RecA-like ATPase